MEKIKIFTAFHKEFEMPNDNFHIPIHVGKAISNINLDIIGDNTGDNISHKNKNYCELTMLYWIWKNYDLHETDFVGLAHYRRLFNLDNKIINKIHNYDIILPKKEIIGSLSFSISLYQQYCLCHIKEDIDQLFQLLEKENKEYFNLANKILKKRNFLYFLNKGHFFNMFIMKKDIFIEYCNFLFDILLKLEENIKTSGYDYQSRVFGFLAERILNIFIEKKRKEGYKILEINVIKK